MALARRPVLLEALEANAEDYWHVPSLSNGTTTDERSDDVYEAAYEGVTFHVTDGANQADTRVTLLVTHTDRPPVLDRPPDRTLREGDRLHFILRLNYPGQDPVSSERAIRAFGEVATMVRSRIAGETA